MCNRDSMDRRETERFLDAIRQARAAGEPAAVATVVRVTGSAYRREGTRMFVRRNGTYECALSGGCLEPTVAEAAARVIATGEPVIVSYDLADDSVWGLGIGCSGAVDIRHRADRRRCDHQQLVDDSRPRGSRRAGHAPFGRVGPASSFAVRARSSEGWTTRRWNERPSAVLAPASGHRIRRPVPIALAARSCSTRSRCRRQVS